MSLRFQRWALPFVLGLVMSLMAQQCSRAHAHSWYEGIRNPKTGEGCCGMRDCFPVDVNDVVENETTYVVTVRGTPWTFPKAEAMPSPDGLYHICIWGGKARCFFFPANV